MMDKLGKVEEVIPPPTKASELLVSEVITKECSPDKLTSPMLIDESILIPTTVSPKVFLLDDNIVNTQKSVGVDTGSQGEADPVVIEKKKNTDVDQCSCLGSSYAM
jgi:hypothetical protein